MSEKLSRIFIILILLMSKQEEKLFDFRSEKVRRKRLEPSAQVLDEKSKVLFSNSVVVHLVKYVKCFLVVNRNKYDNF